MRNQHKKSGGNSSSAGAASFMRELVDAGFGVVASKTPSRTEFVVESSSSFRAEQKQQHRATANKYIEPNQAPPTRYPMPSTIKIRFKPNQNITTPVFEPKFKPYGYPIKNQMQVFDTLAEHRDFLQERYLEAMERVRDRRQEKIDARLEKHQELLDKMKEVAPTWDRLNGLGDSEFDDIENEENEEADEDSTDDE
jgi:hypothetical protein